jgi:molecular chaperone GrpE
MSQHTNQQEQEIQPDKPETQDGQEKPQENAEGAAPDAPEAKIAELEAKLADLNDQLLRKAADFENYRKRVAREKQEAADFSNQSLLLDLLPVIDDFGRAIRSAETSKDFASFYEGVIMIEKRLVSQLENKWGLKGFDSVGEPFDPNRHEALQMEKAGGIAEPVVKEDYERGYLLKDRVIRFAKVKVLMPDEASAGQPAGEAAN